MNKIVTVKRADIKNGVRLHSNECPVAQALHRHFENELGEFEDVSVDEESIRVGDRYFRAPRSVSRFVTRFDDQKRVKPFNFRLVEVND